MSTVGRNDDCPCGSGKKYKKCHMELDEKRGRELRNLSSIDEWAAFHLRRLCDGLAPLADARPEVVAAAETFFLGGERPEHPLDDALFRDHALFDVVIGSAGETLADAFVLPADAPSASDTQVMRTALVSSYLSLLEVTEVKRGKGLGLRDTLTRTESFVWDEALSRTLDPLEVVLGRRLAFTDRPLVAPAWRRVRFHGRRKAIAAAQAAVAAADLPSEDPAARLRWHKAFAPQLVALVRPFDRPV